MPGKKARMGMTIGRIVALVVLLTLASQAILIYIGLLYAGTMDKSMSRQRDEVIADQFEQNIATRLDDINNLLLLLQTPDFSNYFRSLMNLREKDVVDAERGKLLEKLQALQISPDLIESVYFIGANVNQLSYRKDTAASSFAELPGLQTEAIDYAKLKAIFLQDHDQFVRYGREELLRHFDSGSRMIGQDNKTAIRALIGDLQNRLIITNGNKNGVLIIMVLSEELFGRAIPAETGGAVFSVMNDKGQLLWSNAGAGEEPFLASVVSGSEQTVRGGSAYTNTTRELPAYHLRAAYSAARAGGPFTFDLWGSLLTVSAATVAATFLISLVYLKKVFKPFRLISSKLKNKLLTSGNELALQPIPEHLITRGFQAISMRNKIILLFCVAVSLPAALNGLWYARFLTQEVEHWAGQSARTLGDFSVVSIAGQARLLENTANEISVSRQFQEYLTSNSQNANLTLADQINLSMYPGLNDLSYFVLLDQFGNSVYSSIYSNNKEIFSTGTKYLEDRDDPYWIVNYEDAFNHVSIAVMRRIELTGQNRVTYLLLVPKETIFQIMESEQIKATYVMTDRSGRVVRSYRAMPEGSADLTYENSIPGTDWQLEIRYRFNDVIIKNQAYQRQYLLSILIVFLLAAGVAVVIANRLTRPIKQLKETMLAAGNEGIARRLAYEGTNEIAGIIASYNRMIGRLEQTARENMRIMEENTRNKMRENELLSMKMQAELHMLQAQINPHFLYNTLETINMQSMRRGHHEISTMVNALADLLRYSVSKGADTALLDKELNHAANYMIIQQMRFGSSFEAEFDVPDELRRYRVLRFILQPLIENSIKHGFGGWESGGRIVITVAQEETALVIRVRDNGVGMDDGALERLRAGMSGELEEGESMPGGIGLRNVYLRLKLFYKEQTRMEIASALMKGTEITIRLPVEPDPPAACDAG